MEERAREGSKRVHYLLFASLLFKAICKASSDSHFAFLFLGMVLIHSFLNQASIRFKEGISCLEPPAPWLPADMALPFITGMRGRVGVEIQSGSCRIKGTPGPTLGWPCLLSEQSTGIRRSQYHAAFVRDCAGLSREEKCFLGSLVIPPPPPRLRGVGVGGRGFPPALRPSPLGFWPWPGLRDWRGPAPPLLTAQAGSAPAPSPARTWTQRSLWTVRPALLRGESPGGRQGGCPGSRSGAPGRGGERGGIPLGAAECPSLAGGPLAQGLR